MYLIDHWSQVTVLIALITGCIGYLFNLFFSNRDKRRHQRYEIFQGKKLDAYVSFNTSFVEMTLIITTAINVFDVEEFQKNARTLSHPSEDFFKKTIILRSYLSNDSFTKYDLLYAKIMDISTDITKFNTCITKGLIKHSEDKFAMLRLRNYVLESIQDAIVNFERLKKEFQIYYRD
jgi:hypothetical protein